MALHHAASGEVVRLRSVGDPEAKSIALMRTDSFETLHLIVRQGHAIRDHEFKGSISLQCLEGQANIELPDGIHSLSAGDWLYLQPKEHHAIVAISDTSLLMTVMFD